MEAQITVLAPPSTAFESAMVMPRSLNEPRGDSALVFDEHLGTGAFAQARGVDEWRGAFVERNDRSGFRDGKVLRG